MRCFNIDIINIKKLMGFPEKGMHLTIPVSKRKKKCLKGTRKHQCPSHPEPFKVPQSREQTALGRCAGET